MRASWKRWHLSGTFKDWKEFVEGNGRSQEVCTGWNKNMSKGPELKQA